MNLSKRLEMAADQRGRARASVRSRQLTRRAPVQPVIDLDASTPGPAIDLRVDEKDQNDQTEAPVERIVDAEPTVIDEPPVIVPDAAPYDIDAVDFFSPTAAPEETSQFAPGQTERQWTDGLSKRLGRSRFTARRDRDERSTVQPEVKRPVTVRAVEAHTCPRCGSGARVDIHDRTRKLMHLSCDSCFKMWQEPAAETRTPRAD